MSIKCPKCNDDLKEIKISKVLIDRCDNCKGLWFDDKELSAILKDFKFHEGENNRENIFQNDITAKNKCPKCNIPLKIVNSLSISELEIDICSKCSGIWLDYGELNTIKENKNSINFSSIESNISCKDDKAIATYELLGDLRNIAFEDNIKRSPFEASKFDDILKEKISSDSYQWQGKIQLMITGFSKQKIISIKEISRAIEILPDNHLQGLRVVIYDPEKKIKKLDRFKYFFFRRFHPTRRFSIGEYLNKGIVIYEFDSKKLFYEILYHEIGHYVFYRIIGAKLKNEWIEKISPNSNYVSNYALKTTREDFAETYMHFILYGNILRGNIKEKYNFMNEKIFFGFKPDIRKLNLI